MTDTTRRSFTDEFKRKAVSLLASSGRPLMQVATELGIQPSMLRNWRHGVNGSATAATSVPGRFAGAADQLEIRRLTRDLERVQMERGILKPSRTRDPPVKRETDGVRLHGGGERPLAFW